MSTLPSIDHRREFGVYAAADGLVGIVVDPDTARDIAFAWSNAHAKQLADLPPRPRWHDDVVAIHHAAIRADLTVGRTPDPDQFELVLVPGVTGADR